MITSQKDSFYVLGIVDGGCDECGNKEVKGGSSSGHKVTPSVSVIKRTGTGVLILVDKSVVTSLIEGLHWAQLPSG